MLIKAKGQIIQILTINNKHDISIATDTSSHNVICLLKYIF